MNFRTIGLATTVLTTAISMGSVVTPVEAITLKNGDTLTFGGDVTINQVGSNFSFDFFNLSGDNLATVSASSTNPPFVLGDTIGITDFSAPGSVTGFPTVPLTPFLTGILLTDGTEVDFNLESIDFNTFIFGTQRFFNIGLLGKFINGGEVLGEGSLSSQIALNVLTDGNLANNRTTYSANLTAVPTPALLPAALGMGAAALRKKRKQEEADADLAPEPVEA